MSTLAAIGIFVIVALAITLLIVIVLGVADIFQKVEELHKKIMDEDPPSK